MSLNLAIIAYVQYLLQATTKYPFVFEPGIRPVVAILMRRGEENYPETMKQLFSLIGESCYRDQEAHTLVTGERHLALLQEDLLRLTVQEMQQMDTHVCIDNPDYINSNYNWLRWLGINILTYRELNDQYGMKELFAHDMADRKRVVFANYEENSYPFPY